MKFKKYDEIQHPKFGRGIVKKVNKIDDDLSILDVQFDEAGEKKQLNSAWLRSTVSAMQRCRRRMSGQTIQTFS